MLTKPNQIKLYINANQALLSKVSLLMLTTVLNKAFISTLTKLY